MTDATRTRTTHDPQPALVPASEGADLPLPFHAPAMPKCAEGLGALNAGPVPSRLVVSAAPKTRSLREFFAIDTFTGWQKRLVAAGPIAAIDSGDLNDAPVFTMLIGDDPEDASRGRLYAERSARGWELR